MPSHDTVVELAKRGPAADSGRPTREQLAALVARVAERRDRQAFEQLYRFLAPRLQTYMIRIGAGSELADDLVQETLAEVWCKAALYRAERAAVSTWVFTIGRNLAIDRFRKSRSFEVAEESPLGPEPAEQVDYGRQLDALDLLERRKRLSQEQQQVLYLSYVEGLSQSEISRRLDLPLGTVKSRVRLAFARIREEVAEA